MLRHKTSSVGGGFYLHADTNLYQFMNVLNLKCASQNDINKIMRAKGYKEFDITKIKTSKELSLWLEKAKMSTK